MARKATIAFPSSDPIEELTPELAKTKSIVEET